MIPPPESDPSSLNKYREFTTTHWSSVLAAGRTDSPTAREALERLCRTYWYPLYAFVRRSGHQKEDAEDLTQAFFAHLSHKNALSNVQREKGKFRSFLLACLKNFLSSEWRKATAQKRGSGQELISLDHAQAEDWYRSESQELTDPTLLYDRRWATTVLSEARRRLREEYTRSGKSALISKLDGCLPGAGDLPPYAHLARELQCEENTVKSHVTRIRARFAELLRETVSETVSTPAELEEEMRFLRNLLSS